MKTKIMASIIASIIVTGCATTPLTKEEVAEAQKRDRIERQYTEIRRSFGCGSVDPTCFPH